MNVALQALQAVQVLPVNRENAAQVVVQEHLEEEEPREGLENEASKEKLDQQDSKGNVVKLVKLELPEEMVNILYCVSISLINNNYLLKDCAH